MAKSGDIVSNAKARRDGYAETMNSADMFIDLFDGFRAQKIIP